MRWRGSESWRRVAGLAFAVVVLVGPSLIAQHRPDCESEEVVGDRFYDVCGSDRQTLAVYRARIKHAASKSGIATIDELGVILCDVGAEDGAVKALVSQDVAFAASDVPIDENTLLALIESDVMPIIGREGPRRMSDRGVLRLKRIIADRNADTVARCWALTFLIDARGNGVAMPWVKDPSDPILSCAAPVAIKELSDVARQEVLSSPEHPLHLELLLNEPVTEETLGPLCGVASDTAASPQSRVRAIGYLEPRPVSRLSDCLASLLQPEKWFVVYGRHSVEIVLEALLIVDRPRAKLLATSLDTTSIADQELRRAVVEECFFVRAFDPDVPYYDENQEPPQ
jgi:hypothetical protein